MRRASVLAALLLAGCVQTTGGALVEFDAAGSGPADAVAGQPLAFSTPAGFEVTLTKARLLVGAVYLNMANPAAYGMEGACLVPALVTGEVRGALRIDALDPRPQAFPVRGNGTDQGTRSGELWLTSGDVEASEDPAVVAELEGEARRAGERWPFAAAVTIGANRKLPPRTAALPGSNPICKQRIVAPIPAGLTLSGERRLRLRVDPRRWLDTVDFAQLRVDPADATRFRFVDDLAQAGQPEVALFNGLKSARGPYTLEAEVP